MMLDDGFFHAGLHPGNVFRQPDNRIAFIAFGMTVDREPSFGLPGFIAAVIGGIGVSLPIWRGGKG